LLAYFDVVVEMISHNNAM